MLAPPRDQKEHRPALEDAVEPTAERLWGDVSRRLRDTLNETTYETWFSAASGAARSEQSRLRWSRICFACVKVWTTAPSSPTWTR